MVADSMERLRKYEGELTDIGKIVDYLSTVNLMELPVGRYPIPDTEAYFQIQKYMTKLPGEGRWEAHRKYIDVQCVLSGEEYIGWAPIESLEKDGEYDQENDLQWLKESEGNTKVILKANQFGVFFPTDAHMPGCAIQESVENRKMIIKVPAK